MKNIRNKTGALILTFLVVLVLAIFGAALFLISVNEGNIAQRQRMETEAFHIAEAGIERAIYELRQDFITDPSGGWDYDINGWEADFDPADGFQPFPDVDDLNIVAFQDSAIIHGENYYSLKLKKLSSNDAIWVESTGHWEGETARIRIYARIRDYSAWNNAIFGGAGSVIEKQAISGCVDIRGSVHILGEGLGEGDLAVDLGGTADLIGNNYKDLDEPLEDKVPALPTTLFEAETVKTLFAELRVKNGIVKLDGDSSVGQPQELLNDFKETIDGSYVTDGFAGNGGTGNVFSDNGYSNGYDLGDAITFPSLSDPSASDPSKTHQEWFESQAYVVKSDADLGQLRNINSASDFTMCDGSNTNCLIMVPAIEGPSGQPARLEIRGNVYIEKASDYETSGLGDLIFDDKNDTITYTGTGTILVEGDVEIDTSLVTDGLNSFPTNMMAVMTPKTMTLGTTAQADIMGLFYAEDQIKVEKQTDIIGTIVTNYFDLGTNVPNIYQVPETQDYLPDGLLGIEPIFIMKILSWKRLP